MDYDYVIIGAGSAGCALAGRLTEDAAAKVLLLEAGPPDRELMMRVPAGFTKLFKTRYDWNYTTAPQEHLGRRELYWPRGKTLGGSSSINAQMYVRGHRRDYDDWGVLGNPGWTFDDVLPLFLKMENTERGPLPLRGVGGPLNVAELRDPNPATHAFVEAAVKTGLPRNLDVNGPEQDGVDYTQVTQKGGQRCSAARAYLAPARSRANLAVVTGAHATRVLFEGSRAVGVEYVHDGRREVGRARAEVVLAGGTVNSPQLLMLSGIGPAAHLRGLGLPVVADSPGVGENLQDHVMSGVVVSCPRPVTLFTAESIANLLRFLLLKRGQLTSNVGEAVAFVRLAAGAPAPDVELIFAPVPFLDHGLEKPTCHGISIGVVLLQPKSRGAITLQSADPLAPPLIQPRYLSDPGGEDLRLLVEGLKLARRVIRTPPLSDFAGDPIEPGPGVESDADLARFVREQVETLYHPVGTCRMGSDPAAVVDAELRVRGVTGLRVADASVFPRIIRGHTNAPAILVGEKAADLIRGRAPARA